MFEVHLCRDIFQMPISAANEQTKNRMKTRYKIPTLHIFIRYHLIIKTFDLRQMTSINYTNMPLPTFSVICVIEGIDDDTRIYILLFVSLKYITIIIIFSV